MKNGGQAEARENLEQKLSEMAEEYLKRPSARTEILLQAHRMGTVKKLAPLVGIPPGSLTGWLEEYFRGRKEWCRRENRPKRDYRHPVPPPAPGSELDFAVALSLAATDEEFFRRFLRKMRSLPTAEKKIELVRKFATESGRNPFSYAVELAFRDEGPRLEASDIRALLDSKYYFARYWVARHRRFLHGEAREVTERLAANKNFDALLYWAYWYYWDDSASAPLWEAFAEEAAKLEFPEEFLRRVVAVWDEVVRDFRDSTIIANAEKERFTGFVDALLGTLGEKIRRHLAARLGVAVPETAEQRPEKPAAPPRKARVLVAVAPGPAARPLKAKKTPPEAPAERPAAGPSGSRFMPALNRLFTRPSGWRTPAAEALRAKLLEAAGELDDREREYLRLLSEGAFPVVVADAGLAAEMRSFAFRLLGKSWDAEPEPEETAAARRAAIRDAVRRWFEARDTHDIRAWMEDARNPQTSDPALLGPAAHFLLRKTFWSRREDVRWRDVDPLIAVEDAVGALRFVLETCRARLGTDAGASAVAEALAADEGVVPRHFRGLAEACRGAVLARAGPSGALAAAERLRRAAEELDALAVDSLLDELLPMGEELRRAAGVLERTARGLPRILVGILAARARELAARPSLPPGCPEPSLFAAEDFASLLDRAWPAALRAWRERRRGLPAGGVLVPVLSRLLNAHGFLGLSLKEGPGGELRCRWFLRGGRTFAAALRPEELADPRRRPQRGAPGAVLAEILALYALTAAADACGRFVPLSRHARRPKGAEQIEWTVDVTVLPAPRADSEGGAPARRADVRIAASYPRSLAPRPKAAAAGGGAPEGEARRVPARHLVADHLRRLLPGQSPSPEAAERALACGWPYLPPGRTFVRPHWRGGGGPREARVFVPTIHSAALAVSLDALAVEATLRRGADLRALGFEPAEARPGSRLRSALRFAADPLGAAELLRISN